VEYAESDCTQDLYHQQQLEQQEEIMSKKYEQQPGTVSVFKNDKEGNEKRPDYTGNLKTPGGEELRISLWLTTSSSGTTYLSGKVDEPYNGSGSDGGKAQSASDVPF
jgi:hypothetical protein